MQYEIEELGVGGILDRTVSLMQNHFGLLFGITLVLLVPFTLLQGIVTSQKDMSSTVLVLLSSFLILPLSNAALIQAVAKKYLNPESETVVRLVPESD